MLLSKTLNLLLDTHVALWAIEVEYVLAVASLANHHQDPFDRLLVAQALTEPMHFLTHDQTVAKYSDSIRLI